MMGGGSGCEKGAARLLRREIKIFHSLCEPWLVSFVILGPNAQPPLWVLLAVIATAVVFCIITSTSPSAFRGVSGEVLLLLPSHIVYHLSRVTLPCSGCTTVQNKCYGG